jgi:type IV secretory pathway VirB10-like protein
MPRSTQPPALPSTTSETPKAPLISEVTPGGEYYFAFDGQDRSSPLSTPPAHSAPPTPTIPTAPTPPPPPSTEPSPPTPGATTADNSTRPASTTSEPATTTPPPADSPNKTHRQPSRRNRYTYAADNPVNNSDPSGTDVEGTNQDPVADRRPGTFNTPVPNQELPRDSLIPGGTPSRGAR